MLCKACGGLLYGNLAGPSSLRSGFAQVRVCSGVLRSAPHVAAAIRGAMRSYEELCGAMKSYEELY
eukprot:5600428-Prymnesium_polylepis.1